MFRKINDILQNGGIIAFPTDTVWGIGCLPSHEQAVQKIYDIKKRDGQKPLILMSGAITPLLEYVKMPLPSAGQTLIQKYWPGALTLVMQKSNKTYDYITSGKDTVGIRVPNNDLFQEMCQHITGNVLATTSANISGQAPALTYEEALNYIGNKVDFVVPYEQAVSGQASTVVGFSNDVMTIFRQGGVRF